MLSSLTIMLILALLTMPVGAAPDIDRQLTLSDLKITGENIDYTSDASFALYSNEQDGTRTYGFTAVKDGVNALPAAVAITDQSISLKLGESDHYYTFTNDALNEMLSAELSDQRSSTASVALSLADVFVGDEETAYTALSEYFNSYVAANATAATDYTDVLGDTAISGKTVEMQVSLPHLYKALDTLLTSENESVATLADDLLTAVNTCAHTDYSSFSDLSATIVANAAVPVTLTIAASEDGTASRQTWSCENNNDESNLKVLSQLDTQDQNVKLIFSYNKSDADSAVTINADASLNTSENSIVTLDGQFAVSLSRGSDAPDGSDEASAENDNTYIAAKFTCSLGPEASTGNIKGTISVNAEEKAAFSLDIDSRNESEQTVSDFSFKFTETGAEVPFKLSFVTTSENVPYTDPMTGTAVYIDSGFESDPGSYFMLFNDIIAYSRDISSVMGEDVPRFAESSDIASLINTLFADRDPALQDSTFVPDNSGSDPDENDETDEFADSTDDGDAYDDDTADSETADNAFETIEEAAAAFGGHVPKIQTPEGYKIENISADNDSFLVEFTDDGEGYISVFIFNDSVVYDSYPIFYDNEDGTVYAADLLVDNVNVSVYIPDMTVSDAELLFKQMGLM